MNHEAIDRVFEWEEDIANGVPSIIGRALVNDGDGVPERYDIMFAQVSMVGALRSVTTTSVDAGYALKMKVGRVTVMRSNRDEVTDDPFNWSEGYDDAMMFHSVREAVAHAEEVYREYTEMQKTRSEQVERMLVSTESC